MDDTGANHHLLLPSSLNKHKAHTWCAVPGSNNTCTCTPRNQSKHVSALSEHAGRSPPPDHTLRQVGRQHFCFHPPPPPPPTSNGSPRANRWLDVEPASHLWAGRWTRHMHMLAGLRGAAVVLGRAGQRACRYM
jgi:hypothetical protein